MLFIFMFIALVLETLAAGYNFVDGQGVRFSWTNDDVVGLYTSAGSRIRTTVYAIDEDDMHRVQLTGNGWGLSESSTYYGYYPYSSRYYEESLPITALPVSYRGQQQNWNDNVDHLARYDYMHAVTMTTTTSADFAFMHYGSVLRIACQMPKSMNPNVVAVAVKKKKIPVEAFMNLPQQSLEIGELADSVTLTMRNVSLSEGEVMVAYMMMAPVDFTGDTLSVYAIDEAAHDTLKMDVVGTRMLPGMMYQIGNVGSGSGAKKLIAERYVSGFDSSLTLPCATASDFTEDEQNRFRLYLLGDANGDGRVNIEDAFFIIRYFIGLPVANIDKCAADVNKDGEITMADANELLNKIRK